MDHIKTPKVDHVQLLGKPGTRNSVSGCLYLTATHTIFMDAIANKETWILHHHLSSVEKLALSTRGSPLKLQCKTFQTLTFVIPKEKDCQDVYDSLMFFSQPSSVESLYAFSYSPQSLGLDQKNGWDVFDPVAEFKRQGVPNENWKASDANEDYRICETYPRWLYVPETVSNPIVSGSAKFRSKGRLPALSYYYEPNQAAICRCSQPLAGVGKRSEEDEAMLASFLRSNPNRPYMHVVDTRPKINAMANRAAGKGYENTDFYQGVVFQFLGIQNIHVMRESQQKLIDAYSGGLTSCHALQDALEGSHHLKHIKSILDTSLFIAKAVFEEKANVLVHCSDGWDRTAQTCSLAGMMLDPFYRTFRGLQILIEKEWLGFGHKFLDRCGLLHGEPNERSPVFAQFLDCVWQLTKQYPTAFEFNERLLVHIHDHVYSCQFGTFLGNNCRSREQLDLSSRTYSLWGYLNRQQEEYINPLFSPPAKGSRMLLESSSSPQDYYFWHGLYSYNDRSLHPRESADQQLSQMRDQATALEEQAAFLAERISALQRRLGVSNDVVDGGQGSEGQEQLSQSEPLPSEPSPEPEQMFELLESISDLRLDWASPRSVKQCSCATALDQLSYRYHCMNCGTVFCSRCLDRRARLPYQPVGSEARVCRPCAKQLR